MWRAEILAQILPNIAKHSQVQQMWYLKRVFYIYSRMMYPFKDQAKSSSETSIPVELPPPMSPIRDKVSPYSKGKSFQLKIKTTATEK